ALWRVVSEDPMMAGDVGHAPGRGRAAARKLRRDVHDRHEVKLHPAEGLGLVKPEQPALVQELLVVADEHARVLGALGALAQDRHDLARAAHRLVVADAEKSRRIRCGSVPTPSFCSLAPTIYPPRVAMRFVANWAARCRGWRDGATLGTDAPAVRTSS